MLAQVLWGVNLWCFCLRLQCLSLPWPRNCWSWGDKQPTPTWAGGAGAAGPWSAANTKVTTSVHRKNPSTKAKWRKVYRNRCLTSCNPGFCLALTPTVAVTWPNISTHVLDIETSSERRPFLELWRVGSLGEIHQLSAAATFGKVFTIVWDAVLNVPALVAPGRETFSKSFVADVNAPRTWSRLAFEQDPRWKKHDWSLGSSGKATLRSCEVSWFLWFAPAHCVVPTCWTKRPMASPFRDPNPVFICFHWG